MGSFIHSVFLFLAAQAAFCFACRSRICSAVQAAIEHHACLRFVPRVVMPTLSNRWRRGCRRGSYVAAFIVFASLAVFLIFAFETVADLRNVVRIAPRPGIADAGLRFLARLESVMFRLWQSAYRAC